MRRASKYSDYRLYPIYIRDVKHDGHEAYMDKESDPSLTGREVN